MIGYVGSASDIRHRILHVEAAGVTGHAERVVLLRGISGAALTACVAVPLLHGHVLVDQYPGR